MLPVIPNSFYRALPRTGPRSQSAIDQCLNPLTNELRPPTTVPPSPEFTSGFYFLDDILTFKVCTNSNQADYEAPLAQAYKNGTWAAGDVMLLAELVRQDLKSNKRAWRVGPEDKTYWVSPSAGWSSHSAICFSDADACLPVTVARNSLRVVRRASRPEWTLEPLL